MARRVFCRFCGHPAVMVAGKWPSICEQCDGTDHWSTQRPDVYVAVATPTRAVEVVWELSLNDQRLLHRLHILAE